MDRRSMLVGLALCGLLPLPLGCGPKKEEVKEEDTEKEQKGYFDDAAKGKGEVDR